MANAVTSPAVLWPEMSAWLIVLTENVTSGTVPFVTLAVYRKLLIHVMSESW